MVSFFQLFVQENEPTKFDRYLGLQQLPMSEEYNPLKQWNENKLEFPTMAKLARKYLAILASCIPNRRLFLDEKIYDLDLDDINYFVFLKHNLLEFN